MNRCTRRVQPRFGTNDCAACSGSFLPLVSGFLSTKQTEPGPVGRLADAAGRFLTLVVSFLSIGYAWLGRNYIVCHWQNLEPCSLSNVIQNTSHQQLCWQEVRPAIFPWHKGGAADSPNFRTWKYHSISFNDRRLTILTYGNLTFI